MNRAYAKSYSYWFLVPAFFIYGLFFVVPTVMSFFFSMTRWTLVDWDFVGFENYVMFFSESSLSIGMINTIVYATVTAGLKIVAGFLLGVLLTSQLKTKHIIRSIIFFPTLVGTIAVGITFSYLMHPTLGAINGLLAQIGIEGPDWLGDVKMALLSVAFVDVWKGVGIALVIFIAGILAIPEHYYEALAIDGGNAWHKLRYLTLPLSRPALNTVTLLAFIGGLRSFDLIWTMTGGGPGFATDLVPSIIYKQYQAGFYGLATAGNAILVVLVFVLGYPLFKFLSKAEVDL